MERTEEIKYIKTVYTNQPKQAHGVIKRETPELFHKLNAQPVGRTFSEKAWRWVNAEDGNFDNSCYCGKPCDFLGFHRGYREYCSNKCMANSSKEWEKKQKTLQERYGVTHFSKTPEYRKKFEATCIERYGVSNPGQIPKNTEKRSRKKQETFFNKLVEQVKDQCVPKFKFDQYTHVRDDLLEWQCCKCNNVFNSNLFGKLPTCPVCYPNRFGGPSLVEKDILGEIKKIYSGEIIPNSRQIINPKELDIYFPTEKFAIEVNGVYWHRVEKVGKDYHYEKYAACKSKGISLFMITDYEWQNNRELIIRMIRHRLGLQSSVVFAKRCVVKEISVEISRKFMDKNHLHGFSKATAHLGLFFNEELVAACSFSTKSRFSKNSKNIEIIRFALGDISVPGALGKFLSKIQKDYPGVDIETYADLRYGSGDVYAKNKFIETHISKPGYWYFHEGKLQHRLNWTKQKLVKLGHDPKLTESEIMQLLGAIQIFDCGHKHFKLSSKVDNKSNP